MHGYFSYTKRRLRFEYSIATQVITQPVTITYTSDQVVPAFQFTDTPVLFNRNT